MRMQKVNKFCEECSTPMILLYKWRAQRFCSKKCSTVFVGRQKSALYSIEEKTKKDMLESRQNWQSFRSSVRHHANKVFDLSGGKRCCRICDYSRKVEICHIKPIKDFALTATMSEINHPDNLVALCANHHWELDHDLLDAPLIF